MKSLPVAVITFALAVTGCHWTVTAKYKRADADMRALANALVAY